MGGPKQCVAARHIRFTWVRAAKTVLIKLLKLVAVYRNKTKHFVNQSTEIYEYYTCIYLVFFHVWVGVGW